MRAAVAAIKTSHRFLPSALQSFQTSIASNRNRTIVRNIMSETDPTSFTRPRLVTKKVLAKHQREGDGAVVRRCIGRCLFKVFPLSLPFLGCFLFFFSLWVHFFFGGFRSELKSLDPFLMMDDFTGMGFICHFHSLGFFSSINPLMDHCCINVFAVSPPAGFPDHPHRGY